MPKDKQAIIVFAKYPQKGEVKTRLASTTGADFALKFYEKCSSYLFDMLEKIKNKGIVIFLFHANAGSENKMRDFVKKNFYYEEQAAGGLGKKIETAFENVFSKGYDKAVIVGTDVPDHTPENLVSAFEKLEGNDVVVGPCPDGGYYLLGMKRLYKELFEGIEWSTSEVLSKTKKKCVNLGLSFTELPELIDIDDEEDLDKWLGDKSTGNVGFKEVVKGLINI